MLLCLLYTIYDNPYSIFYNLTMYILVYSSEQVKTVFEAYGEIVKCHRPTNLGTREYHPFAFVRFLRNENAITAANEMNRKWVDGQELFVSVIKQKTYYSQDESTAVTKDVKN